MVGYTPKENNHHAVISEKKFLSHVKKALFSSSAREKESYFSSI
jgi:hypothetical protein